MTHKKLSAGARIMRKAAEAGSHAKTVTGALAYLRAHLPKPLARLVHLRSPESQPPVKAPCVDGRKSPTPGVSWTHNARTERRAEALVARLIKTAPKAALSALARRKRRLAPDVLECARSELCRIIAQRLTQHLAGHWPYRRSKSAWAGGEHEVTVTVSEELAARGESCQAWSRNGEWSGTNNYAHLCINPRCYDALGMNFIIGGLVTLNCEAVGPREFAASWAEKSLGFELKVVSGWIVRGYHVAGGTLQAARRKASRARRERLATLYLEKLGLNGLDLGDVHVRRVDSLAAGNCAAGTDSFIRSHALEGLRSVLASELLALTDNVETRAAVLRAAARTLAKARDSKLALGEEGDDISSGAAANDEAAGASDAPNAAEG